MANKAFFAFYEPTHRLKTLSMKNKKLSFSFAWAFKIYIF